MDYLEKINNIKSKIEKYKLERGKLEGELERLNKEKATLLTELGEGEGLSEGDLQNKINELEINLEKEIGKIEKQIKEYENELE